jgi:MFS family permease
MTAIAAPAELLAPSPLPVRLPVITRQLLIRFVSIVCASVSFYLPLSVVPLYAASIGAQGSAGLGNGALLLATVAGELVTPRIVARIGYRCALAGGLFLLGAPALLMTSTSSTSELVAISALRGAGFALTVVAGGALTATLIPDQRRGEGLAVVGLVSGIPSLIALPAGVWLAHRCGFAVVFEITAVAPLLALVTLPALPGRTAADAGHVGISRVLRNPALTRPATVFAACTAAAGVVVTYVPLAVGATAPWLAPAALFVQPAVSTGTRWIVGRVGDRVGQSPLLLPGLLLSIAGMALLSVATPVVVLLGAAVFGAGFGILQNATLALMYGRVPSEGYTAVSAVWNGAYDVGMAIGAVGVGALVPYTGFGLAFLITAAAMTPALVLARRG